MPRSNKRGSSTPGGGRGGRGGRGRGSQRGGRSVNVPASRRDPLYTPELSLTDEAKHTSQHSHWDSHSSLRQKPIAFVSAGASEPLKQLDDDLLRADDNGEAKPHHPYTSDRGPSPGLRHISISDAATGSKIQTPIEQRIESRQLGDEECPGPEPCDSDLFFFDLKGERSDTHLGDKGSIELPERLEHTSSSSEDEVILFRGRDASRRPSNKGKSTITLTQMETEIRVVEENIRVASEGHVQSSDGNRVKSSRGKQRQCCQARPSDDDALVADYIANMRENGEIHSLVFPDSRNTRDLGGFDDGGDHSLGTEAGGPRHDSTRLKDTNGTIPNGPSSRNSSEKPRGPDADNHHPYSESESDLDYETLAKLFGGREPNPIPNMFPTDDSSSFSSSKLEEYYSQRDEFDVMDWDRPSLRRKRGKGQPAQPSFNISDSELEETLQAAWRSDRLKKSQRKKQREELRALGMLGKKKNKPEDLRVKYPTGMNMRQVAEEVKDFLLGTEAVLSLPPMDTHARKMIHELANKFNIKSKSTGKADQRRPTLHRTGRTLPYVETSFDQAVAKINRRYFPRLDVKGKRSKRTTQQNHNNTAASYREGEVVGAAAPELGSDNRGRAMLEKMGWSSGTALGALDNKGILQPVPQTMKKSKAGLG